MAEVEFIYNSAKTIIQCNKNDKMKDIFQKFKQKTDIDNNTDIFYTYAGKAGFKEELTFEEIANKEDRKRNKMNVLVYNYEVTVKNKDIIKSKNIICPECKENIKMDIKDYKINLYDCINGHIMENILLNEFDEIQNIDLLNIKCAVCKRIIKVYHIIIYFINV